MLQMKTKPEAIHPVHTMDRYREILLENVPKTQHKALQRERQEEEKNVIAFNLNNHSQATLY